MDQADRQQLHATLTGVSLEDINSCWSSEFDTYSYEVLRKPETGMVMATARVESTGAPFNLGEVSVTRCAIRLQSGETGIGYVKGREPKHAIKVAVIDALAQRVEIYPIVAEKLLNPLALKVKNRLNKKMQETEQTRVEFLTMARGEDT